MMPEADQLDIQSEQARRVISKAFYIARTGVREWTPAPCPPKRPRGTRR
jgi:hypothetical protein